MIIYIAGPITGHLDYKEKFARAERKLKDMGHIVINPSFIPDGLGTLEDYMHICKSVIDKAQGIYMLKGWISSEGSVKELRYAKQHCKKEFYEEDVMKGEVQL